MESKAPSNPNGAYQTLSVLMPVRNEARTLREIVRRVLQSPIELDIELVCVNDGSTDGSGDLLTQLASEHPDARAVIRVIHHESGQGKGAAIRSAIKAMTGDIALIQDADLEYDPEDYPKLLGPILSGEADAVFGSRFITGRRRQVHRFWHAQANRLLTLLCNMVSNLSLTDMETCYKAVRADVLKNMPLVSNRFEIEVELTMRLARRRLRIYEVPISYHGRTAAEGKKIGFTDGLHAVWAIIRFGILDRR
ncbi:MAG: glycosyltransferase family 2 protein [Phycisphaerales bacterium JB058]